MFCLLYHDFRFDSDRFVSYSCLFTMNPNHEMKISKECIELPDMSRRKMYVTFSIIEVGYTS